MTSNSSNKSSTGRGDTSYLAGGNLSYLDQLYHEYLNDPASVGENWRKHFAAIPSAQTGIPKTSRSGEFDYRSKPWSPEAAQKQSSVLRLVNAFRTRGHQVANLDPLGLTKPQPIPDFDLDFNDLTEADMDTVFNTGSFAAIDELPLREFIDLCREIYCGPVGSEYMYITNTQEKRWIQARLETLQVRAPRTNEERRHILERLTASEGLERYLHTKYVGQKRFSLEGGESLIPMLSDLIQRSGASGTREIVIGMAHRGRLNVLVNTLGKLPSDLFSEFEGKYSTEDDDTDTGDVKYHQGFSSDILTPGGPVHLALSFNPSHLEIIDPVVEGSVRARQERRDDRERSMILPVLIHGDAAFAGQGVIMETFNMSQARGYGTGGTVHIIVNNQIGFTTSNPLDARSTLYCTEVAKMVQAPIFHVNADDPDAVIFVTELALDFRMQFHKDVVIDLVCYRRHGHNEADEPAVTQPIMYRAIRSHPTTRQIYAERLITEGVMTNEEVEQLVIDNRDALDEGRVIAGQIIDPNKAQYMVDWTPYIGAEWTDEAETSVSAERLQTIWKQLEQLPEDFELHPRVRKIMDDRAKMAAGELPMDWGFAETMAYATLIDDGYAVRLSGQDSGRGTFFHRHAVLHNQKNRDTYVPLRNIEKNPDKFLVINSLLSEEAVLGFEYGYATTEPNTLVIWEGQFGDFVNGAQVVIDQFISSGEAKWKRLCGLTMLLPHGYEGQGPEHSSARLERFLQLCAEHNMQVCVPTTPAQMFHMMRRQIVRPMRRPLIVMSPKSLLRHKQSVSHLEDLTRGEFQSVIPEIESINSETVKRIILCTGKVYYDILTERSMRQQDDVAIIRMEQLHPFPKDLLTNQLNVYPAAKEIVWCQEEPKNQGAWYQIRHHVRDCLRADQELSYAGREASPSPAVGYHSLHLQQQTALVDQALTLTDTHNVERINAHVN